MVKLNKIWILTFHWSRGPWVKDSFFNEVEFIKVDSVLLATCKMWILMPNHLAIRDDHLMNSK